MLQKHPVVDGLSRLGAISALVVFLFVGLSNSLSYGHSIGEFFTHSFAGTPLETAFFETLLIVIGTILGGLAGMMLFILAGALGGSAIGVIIVRYVLSIGEKGKAG